MEKFYKFSSLIKIKNMSKPDKDQPEGFIIKAIACFCIALILLAVNATILIYIADKKTNSGKTAGDAVQLKN